MKTRVIFPTAFIALATCAPAFAAALPAPQTANGVTYVSGGIGRDEAKAMKAEAKHYPLSVILSAGKEGAYVADAKVTIAKAGGKTLLDSVSAGPIMLVRLPAGRYHITATAEGKTLARDVAVKAKGERQVVLHWAKIA